MNNQDILLEILAMKKYNLITLFASICTFLAFLGTLWQIWRIKKQKKQDDERDKIKLINNIPRKEIGKYHEVYEILDIYYYGSPIYNNSIKINKQYFHDALVDLYDKVPLLEGEEMFNFPLITCKKWVPRLCDNFSNDYLNERLESGKYTISNEYISILTDFLKKRGISDYPLFLNGIGKNIWNSPTFDTYEINSNKKLNVNFTMGNYFNYLKFYDILEKELYLVLLELKRKNKSFPKKTKFWKNKLEMRNCFGLVNIDDLKMHPLKVGVNVFIALKHNDYTYKTFLHKRDDKLVEYPGMIHVTPAGTFQPLNPTNIKMIDKQFDFKYTIAREILEELFGLEEADKAKNIDPFNIFNIEIIKDKLDSSIKKILKENKYSEIFLESIDKNNPIIKFNKNFNLIFTGLFVDVLSFKIEATFALISHNNNIYKKFKALLKNNWEGSIIELDVPSNNFNSFIVDYLKNDYLLPACSAAIIEGAYYLKKSYKDNFKRELIFNQND